MHRRGEVDRLAFDVVKSGIRAGRLLQKLCAALFLIHLDVDTRLIHGEKRDSKHDGIKDRACKTRQKVGICFQEHSDNGILLEYLGVFSHWVQ